MTLWFIGLSALVYIVPTALGYWFFYYSLNTALDHELTNMASSLGHAIDLQGDKPKFRDWERVVQTNPAHSLTTIQLYDKNGFELEHYGAAGINHLILSHNEDRENGRSMRIRTTALVVQNRIVGYLQFEIPTKERDDAIKYFAGTMALIAPFVLLGLGFCSYFVAGKATVPIEETVRLLRQFMADAGHELNTPLSIIEACNEALAHKLTQKGIQLKETTVLSNSTERMQKIIDDLSLLAELETPVEFTGNKNTMSINELVNQCLTDFSVKFEQKNISVNAPNMPPLAIMGNKEELTAMISNLLENALRYTNDGGTIEVEVVQDSHAINISVSDTGIGIPSESLPHIFDRFYRVDKSRSRASGGTGLGLPIARAIAEKHNGTIDVMSTPGLGTKFTITLPVQA